ncbi:MAG: hypothetical protein WAN03_01695 [Candidatus Sulfotelmatobacter sp.]
MRFLNGTRLSVPKIPSYNWIGMNTSKEVEVCRFNPAKDEPLRLNLLGIMC